MVKIKDFVKLCILHNHHNIYIIVLGRHKCNVNSSWDRGRLKISLFEEDSFNFIAGNGSFWNNDENEIVNINER